jgi:hypothetical protein
VPELSGTRSVAPQGNIKPVWGDVVFRAISIRPSAYSFKWQPNPSSRIPRFKLQIKKGW